MKKGFIILSSFLLIFSFLVGIKVFSNSKPKQHINFRETESYNTNTWQEFVLRCQKNGFEVKNPSTPSRDVHIHNKQELSTYLRNTGRALSGDTVWFENTEDIQFPTGTYLFTSPAEFYFPGASGNTKYGNVDFNNSAFAITPSGGVWFNVVGDQKNRSIKNLTVYGSPKTEFVGTTNTTSGYYRKKYGTARLGATNFNESGAFYLQAIKASNLSIKNMDFNNAQAENTHILDIMAGMNIQIDNITNRGYLENWSATEMKNAYNYKDSDGKARGNHTFYSEMIQIDVAKMYALGKTWLTLLPYKAKSDSPGSIDPLSGEFKRDYLEYFLNQYETGQEENIEKIKKKYKELFGSIPSDKLVSKISDGVATKRTTVSNIRSVSYYGMTGEGVWRWTQPDKYTYNPAIDNTKKLYASTIGGHSIESSPYELVKFNNNYFENVINANVDQSRRNAPIHMNVVSKRTRDCIDDENNELGCSASEKVIKNDTAWQRTSITFSGNKYIKCSSNFTDSNHPEVKTESARYIAGFDKTSRGVDKVKFVDEDGNEIKTTYNGYYPEEYSINNKYVFKSSSYDANTKTLTRKYRKVIKFSKTLTTKLDTNSNVIDEKDINKYKLKTSTLKSRTTETLPNGDSITVYRYTETYEKKTINDYCSSSEYDLNKKYIFVEGKFNSSKITPKGSAEVKYNEEDSVVKVMDGDQLIKQWDVLSMNSSVYRIVDNDMYVGIGQSKSEFESKIKKKKLDVNFNDVNRNSVVDTGDTVTFTNATYNFSKTYNISSNTISFDGLTVEGDIIKNIKVGTRLSAIADTDKIHTNGATILTKDKDGQVVDRVAHTGDIIEVKWSSGDSAIFRVSVLGDVYEDGKITNDDVNKLNRYFAKLKNSDNSSFPDSWNITEDYVIKAADVSKNGSITNDDIVKLNRYYAKLKNPDNSSFPDSWLIGFIKLWSVSMGGAGYEK